MRRVLAALPLLVLLARVGPAHPHFTKTVSVRLPSGVQVTLDYATVPANETHTRSAKVGDFLATNRRPLLVVSGELKGESGVLAAGDYTIGVVKKGENDWQMALHPGKLPRGEAPESAKLIPLDSMFETGRGTAEHMLVDVRPGHGRFEGKAVLTLHFGSLHVSGLLPQ